MAHVDEVAQPVEEIGELVEVALELDRDRDRLVTVQRDRRGCGRDLLEGDAAVLGDPVQLEHDAGHVRLVGHRLRQAKEVGDADLRARLCLQGQGARGVDRIARVGDLLVERCSLGMLRGDQDEVAADPGEHEPEHDQPDQQRLGHSALHEPPPGFRMSAAITKWTTWALPTLVSVLCWSWTLTRSGTTASRLSSRATAAWEYV